MTCNWYSLISAMAIASNVYLQSCRPIGNTYTSFDPVLSPKDHSRSLAPSSRVYLERQLFRSAVHGTSIPYAIILPPSYNNNSTKRYPVILWLHGAAGGLQSVTPLSIRFKGAMDSEIMQESIIVLPESMPLSMWVNSNSNDYMIEDILIKELMPHVLKSYRVLPGVNHSTVAGFSMGGYGAARLGLKYPQYFSKIVMLGAGTLDPSLDNTPRADAEIRDNVLSKVFGNSSSIFYSESPRYYANKNLDTIKRAGPQLTLIVGTKDEVLDQNRRFFQYLRSLGLNPALVLLPGVNHSLKNYFMVGGEKIFRLF